MDNRPSPNEALTQRWPIAVALVAAFGMGLAWWQRFTLDDAFISFRYARHLAAGHGFVWNVGEPPVEGFTNFLWTVLLAGAGRLGLAPEHAAHVLGVACLGGTLVATAALARRWTGSPGAALACAALAAVNPTVSAYATSGLETSLQTMLFTGSMALLAESASAGRWSPRKLVALGAIPAVAVTVRMDSALLLVVVLASVARLARRDTERPLRALAWSASAAAMVLLPWAAVRLTTFHSLLPNSFWAKVAGDTPALARGGAYLAAFGLLSLALPLGALTVASFVRAREAAVAPALALAAAWCGYVAWVGGDFMDFRFMTPIVPMGLSLAAWAVEREIPNRAARVALSATLGGVFLLGWQLARGEAYYHPSLTVETVRTLGRHIDHPDENWRGIGRRLGEAFGAGHGVTLAVTAAGAIPYESDLRTIDMYGLNDRWIARHAPIVASNAPGHRRVATVDDVLSRGANLVVCISAIWLRGEPRNGYTLAEVRRQFLGASHGAVPKGAQVIEIPLDEGRAFRVLYVQPHPDVEAHLHDPGWRVFPIGRSR